jgi:23S rRNA (guanine745-N1)-methyltransferase
MAVVDVLDLLACPLCRQPLAPALGGRAVCCPDGHSFDLARQGYLNLLGAKAPRNADTAAMVAARDRFLSAGHYAPIADRLLGLASEALGGRAARGEPRALEVGAGTGYYLARVLSGLPSSRGVALDVSVPAARRAAAAAPRLGSVVADLWRQLPLRDGCVDVLLDVFAPRNAAEFARVLAPAGVLVTVTPAPEHLQEIRESLGLLDIQPDKDQRLDAALGTAFREIDRASVRFGRPLDRPAVRDLVAMGPNAFHRSEDELDAVVLQVAAPVDLSVAVDLRVWRPRS